MLLCSLAVLFYNQLASGDGECSLKSIAADVLTVGKLGTEQKSPSSIGPTYNNVMPLPHAKWKKNKKPTLCVS